MTKLKKAAVMAAAQCLSYEEIKGLKELFKWVAGSGLRVHRHEGWSWG